MLIALYMLRLYASMTVNHKSPVIEGQVVRVLEYPEGTTKDRRTKPHILSPTRLPLARP